MKINGPLALLDLIMVKDVLGRWLRAEFNIITSLAGFIKSNAGPVEVRYLKGSICHS